MKTRLLIIIGIIITISIMSIFYIPSYFDCPGFLQWDLSCSFSNFVSSEEILPDPICFVIGAGNVSLDGCFALSAFEKLGCDKAMLEFAYKHTNLLDEQFDGSYYYRNAIGLHDSMSEEKLDICLDSLNEKRLDFIENKGFSSMIESGLFLIK